MWVSESTSASSPLRGSASELRSTRVPWGSGYDGGELVCGRRDGWSCTSLVSVGASVVPAGNTRDRAVRDDGDGEELGVSRTVATRWWSTGRCGGPTISPAT